MFDVGRPVQPDDCFAGSKERAVRQDVTDAIIWSRAVADMSVAAQAQMLVVITEAMEAAWTEAGRVLGGVPDDPLPMWSMLAKRIIDAVGEGERDPERLVRVALANLDTLNSDRFSPGRGSSRPLRPS